MSRPWLTRSFCTMVKKIERIGKASVSLDWDLNPIPPDSNVLLLFKYDQCVL